MTDKLRVTAERNFSAHHLLLLAAKSALADADESKPGWRVSALTGITLSALAVEAVCNAIGETVIYHWKDFESAGPIAKVRILCDHFHEDFLHDRSPWSTLIWLMRIRNKLAHAKPEVVRYEGLMTREEHDSTSSLALTQSKLEMELTLANARRALSAVEGMLTLFCEHIPSNQLGGLMVDTAYGSAMLDQT